jgi:hypothetical protein
MNIIPYKEVATSILFVIWHVCGHTVLLILQM